MFSKKYIADYGVEYDSTPNGRIISRPVYKGKYFVFSSDRSQVRAAAKLLIILCAISWPAYFLPLCFHLNAARAVYAAVPYVCSAIPLFGLTTEAFGMLTVKQPMKREVSDKFLLGLPRSSLSVAVLAAIAAVGLLYRLIIDKAMVSLGDIIFGVCAAALIASSVIAYRNRRFAKTVESKPT